MLERKEEFLPINQDLNVAYTLWPDGSEFRRRIGWWGHMEEREWIEPKENKTLLRLMGKGIILSRVEHVSFTVSGKVYYTYDTPEGFAEDVGVAGEHNVENGAGYLSLHPFSRRTDGNHMTCCIVRNLENKSDRRYDFEILTDQTLSQPATFIHYCLGPKQKITEYDLKPGFEIQGTAIIGNYRG